MNMMQKTIFTLLGFGLVALLSNSVSANEQPASKDECAYSSGNEHEYGAHSDKHIQAVYAALQPKSKGECAYSSGNEHERGAHFEKHMQALHAALKLSASQEVAWTEFSTKSVRMDRPGHQDWTNLSTPDRLDRMLDNMKSHEKNMTEHAAIVRAFYDTLNQDQKKIFDSNFMEHHRRHDKESHDNK